jgi:hypothetical protein
MNKAISQQHDICYDQQAVRIDFVDFSNLPDFRFDSIHI